jgi:hypothetical protein
MMASLKLHLMHKCWNASNWGYLVIHCILAGGCSLPQDLAGRLILASAGQTANCNSELRRSPWVLADAAASLLTDMIHSAAGVYSSKVGWRRPASVFLSDVLPHLRLSGLEPI